MARAAAKIEVQEHPGDQFPDLEVAQQATLQPLAAGMAATVRALLAAGILMVQDGCIMIKPPSEQTEIS